MATKNFTEWCIDDPYTLEQLMSPRMNVSIVRPLTDRLFDPDDPSMGEPFTIPYEPKNSANHLA